MKEKDLFPPLKKHFKEKGYSVFVEVPCFYRGVDFVAVNNDDHVAVELKLTFNDKVVHQAHDNIISFGKSYIAFPVKQMVNFNDPAVYWKLKESVRERYDRCQRLGIGIFQFVGQHMIIVEVLEAVYQKPYRVFDFSQFTENDEDEAGLPYQKGVSAGYYELEAIKEYVRAHPQAKWREIYENVQNHYSSPASLGSSMRSWRGFDLQDFKNSLKNDNISVGDRSIVGTSERHDDTQEQQNLFQQS